LAALPPPASSAPFVFGRAGIRQALLVGLVLAGAWACLAVVDRTAAWGRPTVRLSSTFTPDQLGARTTIGLSFRILYPRGESPLAATRLELFLPHGLGIATSELGLQNCILARLERDGRAGCPPNSLMGRGSAITAVPFGSRFVVERTGITLFSGPLQDGHPQLLFVAVGEYPVIAEVAFSALVLPAGPRFGGLIDTMLPLVPSVPDGPNVALLGLATTIGPAGITYRENVGGRTVSFHPKGILLPRSCPRGGFPFAVQLSFIDGSSAGANASVPCPRKPHRGSGGRHPGRLAVVGRSPLWEVVARSDREPTVDPGNRPRRP
jgi:hypothetical protein